MSDDGWLSPFAYQDFQLYEYDLDRTKAQRVLVSYTEYFHGPVKNVFINADNPKIGKVCVIPTGITEIPSIQMTVQVGQHVKEGDQLGNCSYGAQPLPWYLSALQSTISQHEHHQQQHSIRAKHQSFSYVHL